MHLIPSNNFVSGAQNKNNGVAEFEEDQYDYTIPSEAMLSQNNMN
jgi:hypothetical protein